MALKKASPLILGLFFLFPLVAQADALVRPRAGVGFTSYSLDIPSTGESTADSTFLTLQYGVTIAVENFYIDFGASNSLSASYSGLGASGDQDFERNDNAIVVGFAFEKFALFGGIKNGSSTYSNPYPGATEMTFEASGPFFGISGSTASDSGVLSYNVALAILTATLKDNDTFGIPYDAESTASTGFSFGVGYTKFLSDTSSLSFKGQYQLYSYVDWEDPNWIVDDIDESLVSFDVTYVVNF